MPVWHMPYGAKIRTRVEAGKPGVNRPFVRPSLGREPGATGELVLRLFLRDFAWFGKTRMGGGSGEPPSSAAAGARVLDRRQISAGRRASGRALRAVGPRRLMDFTPRGADG